MVCDIAVPGKGTRTGPKNGAALKLALLNPWTVHRREKPSIRGEEYYGRQQRVVTRQQYGQRFRQQRPGRVADASSQLLDQTPVELVHHPVHLLQRQTDPEILLELPDAAPLAVGVGDARHHDMEQDVMGGWMSVSRQQIVEAELPVHRTVNLMDAGDHPLFLFE